MRCPLTSDLPGSSALEHSAVCFPSAACSCFSSALSKRLFSASVSPLPLDRAPPGPGPSRLPLKLSYTAKGAPHPPPASCRSCSRCAPTASGTSSASFSMPTPVSAPPPAAPPRAWAPAPPGCPPRAWRPAGDGQWCRVTQLLERLNRVVERAACLARRGPAWARAGALRQHLEALTPARTPGTAAP